MERLTPSSLLGNADIEISEFNADLFRRSGRILEAAKETPVLFPRPEWRFGCLKGSELHQVEYEIAKAAFVESISFLETQHLEDSPFAEMGRSELKSHLLTARWEEFSKTAARAAALSCTLVKDTTPNEMHINTVTEIPFLKGSLIRVRPAAGYFMVDIDMKDAESYKRHLPDLKKLASIFEVRAFGHCDQSVGYNWLCNKSGYALKDAEKRGYQSYHIDSTEAFYAFLVAVKDMQIARN